MDLARFCRHIVMSPLAARSIPPATLDALQAQVTRCEQGYRGELRFVVEAELTTAQLWRDLSSRNARARSSRCRVCGTRRRTTACSSVLRADRRVEIVADRGIASHVADDEWQGICRMMESHYREGSFEQGSLAGIEAVSALLARHFPASGARPNELEDRPALI
jgi:uncharacterized membrane protein